MACYHIPKVRAALEKAIEAANSKAVSRANKVLVDNNLDSSDQAGDDIIPEILGSKVCLAFFWLQHLFWGIDTNIEGHLYSEMKTVDCSLEFKTYIKSKQTLLESVFFSGEKTFRCGKVQDWDWSDVWGGTKWRYRNMTTTTNRNNHPNIQRSENTELCKYMFKDCKNSRFCC